jgi:heme/copper-type cytochrome/quinol oxidase subunit 1
MNFVDKSLKFDGYNIWNKVVTLHKPQMVLKTLSLYTYTFLTLAAEVLLFCLKLSCRIFTISLQIFFQFFFCWGGGGGFALVHPGLQTTPEEKNYKNEGQVNALMKHHS